MCTGVEIALIATAVVSTGVAIDNANQQAKAAAATGRNIASQAGQEQDAAQAEADRIRETARRQRAQAQASLAAGGVDVGAGTALKIDEEIARGGEYDALNAIITGGRGANALSEEAANYGRQAKAAKAAGYGQAASTLMSAAATGAKASGWRSSGPGFSGTQTAAPITDSSIRING